VGTSRENGPLIKIEHACGKKITSAQKSGHVPWTPDWHGVRCSGGGGALIT
jgi:hypothetical protein